LTLKFRNIRKRNIFLGGDEEQKKLVNSNN
jgi:hypothetical protein